MDGEYCQEGVNRQVRLQMYCDHMGRLGSVADYYVTVEAPCTYVVTFPTIHGCPKVASASPISTRALAVRSCDLRCAALL
eukprot:2257546-Rhodomonas_salina.1